MAKTKEEALEACAEQHHALVACFKTCSVCSAFTGCCTEEHKTFWVCYTQERGTNQTRINNWLDGIFGDGGGSSTAASPAPVEQQPLQQAGEPQQQADEPQPEPAKPRTWWRRG